MLAAGIVIAILLLYLSHRLAFFIGQRMEGDDDWGRQSE